MNSTTPTPTRTLSFWRVLLLGSLVIALLETIAIVAGANLGAFATFFILLLGSFVAGGLAARSIGDWGGIAAGIGFLLAAVVSYSAQPLWLVFTGQKIALDYPISVTNAPQHNVVLFKFTDAKVQTKYPGYYSYSGRTMRSPTGGRGENYTNEYIVAPLTDSNWTTESEVPVWVVCHDSWDHTADVSDTDTCRRDWPKDIGMGAILDISDSPEIKTAIADAETKFNLRSHPNAKYIVWSEDAILEANGAKGLGMALMVITHLGYIVTVVVKRKSL